MPAVQGDPAVAMASVDGLELEALVPVYTFGSDSHDVRQHVRAAFDHLLSIR